MTTSKDKKIVFVIVREKTTGEYAYWPSEEGGEEKFPEGYEKFTDEKFKDGKKFATEQEAIAYIQALEKTPSASS